MGRLLVTLAGNPASGKTEVATNLAENHGFKVLRPSGLIREYADEQGIALRERRDYSQTFNEMIAREGSDRIVERILGSTDGNLCVDGERLPQHILRLRKHGAFVVAIWCPIDVRYGRAVERAEVKDKLTFDDFRHDEALEYQSSEAPGISTLTVMQMADYHIDGAQTREDVRASVDEIIAARLEHAQGRP